MEEQILERIGYSTNTPDTSLNNAIGPPTNRSEDPIPLPRLRTTTSTIVLNVQPDRRTRPLLSQMATPIRPQGVLATPVSPLPNALPLNGGRLFQSRDARFEHQKVVQSLERQTAQSYDDVYKTLLKVLCWSPEVSL